MLGDLVHYPEEISYAYITVPEIFMSFLEDPNKKLTQYVDEFRAEEAHSVFLSDTEIQLMEMPMTISDSGSMTNLLTDWGIPFLVDCTYTDEYSGFQGYLLNPKMVSVAAWTTLDIKPDIPHGEQIPVDISFINEYSKLRITHLLLNPELTPKDTIDAYLAIK